MDSVDGLLQSMGKIRNHNTMVSSTLGARALVLGKFVQAAISYLDKTQCVEIKRCFRQGIEEVMAMMDDTPLAKVFHSELLSLTNAVIENLKLQAAPQQ